MNTENKELIKVIARRFFKGAVAGSLASITAFIANTPTTAPELLLNTYALVFAVFIGFITGGLLAIEKLLNYTPSQT